VYYQLTDYGAKLETVINSLQIWGSIEPPRVEVLE